MEQQTYRDVCYGKMTFSCVDFVRQMVQLAASVNAQNKDGWTPLHYATGEKNVDVVRFLLEKGAYVNVLDKVGQTPLYYAVLNKSVGVVHVLLVNGADLNVQDKDILQETKKALLYSVQKLERATLGILLKVISEILYVDGKTPLLLALRANDLDLVRLLVERGADVNVQNEEGETALFWAVRTDDMDLVHLLVNHGAKVNVQNKEGETALFWAVRSDNMELVRLLIKHGAKVNVRNKDGKTPLLFALRANNLDLVRLLVERGADVNVQDEDGKTPLLLALRTNNLDLVRLLVETNADVNIQNKEGETVLFWAVRTDDMDLVRLLINHGANVNVQNKDGVAPLDLALKNYDVELVRLLVKKGATGNAQNEIDITSTEISYSKYGAVAVGLVCVWVLLVCLLHSISSLTVLVNPRVDIQLPKPDVTLPCNITTQNPRATYAVIWRSQRLNGDRLLSGLSSGQIYKVAEFNDTAFLGDKCSLVLRDPKPEYSDNYSVTVVVPEEQAVVEAQVCLNVWPPVSVTPQMKTVNHTDNDKVTSQYPSYRDSEEIKPWWVFIPVVSVLLLVCTGLVYCRIKRRRQNRENVQSVDEMPETRVPLCENQLGPGRATTSDNYQL